MADTEGASELRADLEWWTARLERLRAKPMPTDALGVLSRTSALIEAEARVRSLHEQLYPTPCTDPNAEHT